MGPITRAIKALGTGVLRHRQNPTKRYGFDPSNPHVYKSRVGFSDFDYYLHMNNAAYFSHGEAAKFQMVAENGLIQPAIEQKVTFVLTAQAIRYRREIRFLRPFRVETFFAGVTDRESYLIHNFRCHIGRLCAQIYVGGVFRRGREIVPPIEFLQKAGIEQELLDKLDVSSREAGIQETTDKFSALETVMRKNAAEDDDDSDRHCV